ncbi:MAG TPA: hypothetical protein VFM37_05990, partial [Pseudonocardiaceae bacterium]|nr:hypothetical protein [Pseudonocardiaceae bacterium]
MALKIGELVGFLKINRTDWARGIDYAKRSLVTLGAHVAAVGRANGLILLAATGIQAAAAIAPVSGALLVIPAAAAVAGVALGAVKAATAGMGDAMRAVASGDAAALEEALTKLSPAARAFVRSWAGLRDGFKPIQQAVQERFFLGLDQDLRAFTKSTLPGLRAGLEPTADALNGLAREGVQAASTPLFSGLLAQVGTSSARSLGALQGVVRLLVATVANAAKVGLPLVERLSAMAGAALRARLAFWGSAAGADAMRATLDRGAATMGRLTSIAGSLAATLAGVFGAAGLAGAKDLLGAVDQLAARMAAWVNSASGQDALQGWFASMADLGSRVVDVAGQVFDVLALVLGVMDSLPGPVQGAVTQFVAWSIVLGPIVGRLVGVGGAVLTLVGHLGKGTAVAYRWLFT